MALLPVAANAYMKPMIFTDYNAWLNWYGEGVAFVDLNDALNGPHAAGDTILANTPMLWSESWEYGETNYFSLGQDVKIESLPGTVKLTDPTGTTFSANMGWYDPYGLGWEVPYGFGFDVHAPKGSFDYTIGLIDNTTLTGTVAKEDSFFGYIDPNALWWNYGKPNCYGDEVVNSWSISDAAVDFTIGNFRVTDEPSVPPVPEPASLCLLGLAGGAIGTVLKKRKKA
jgi:hypothetical protein